MADEDLGIPTPTPGVAFHLDPVPEVTTLPDVQDKTKLNIMYPLIPPYAFAHIYWDPANNETRYEVEEPKLDDSEENILAIVEKGIEELINISFINVKRADVVIVYLEKNITVLLAELGIKVSEETFLKIMYYIYRNFVGLNQIDPLMKDYFIEDIECNGVNAPIYLVHRKYRSIKTNIIFKDPQELTSFVEKLAQKCGKYISYAHPILDGRLPDGSRVNATYTQDISTRGPTFTVRRFTTEPYSPVKLLKLKTMSPEMLAYLWLVIEHEANFLVIGGTGSGKTSLLNSLAFFIPPESRIVSIEDTHELSILHENWLPSVAREATGVGAEGNVGEIDLFALLKASFRQRPDYVIVGEIRGKEAYVLFQGAASGHAVACTLHAEDVDTMIRRLETEPINLPGSLLETIDVVCIMGQVHVNGEEVRRVKGVAEIVSVSDNGEAITNMPFVWDPRTDTFFFKTESVMFNKLVQEFGLSPDYLQKEFSRRTRLFIELYKRNIMDYREVQRVINAYYKMPEEVARKFNL
ncbi:MAG TPA: type II/IV secretion system ATPase subunit [Candidatus Nanoarchaeia archaeon]|nr:type II/IV secretion system ATPase subunit [Candidatus Nanoarchaeia archaeon]